MNLFGFKKKETVKKSQCECNGNCNQETSRIMVLGACCKKASESYENVSKAALQLGISEKVINVSDNIVIANYGVMSTPALVIDEEVLTNGKYISVEEALDYLKDFK